MARWRVSRMAFWAVATAAAAAAAVVAAAPSDVSATAQAGRGSGGGGCWTRRRGDGLPETCCVRLVPCGSHRCEEGAPWWCRRPVCRRTVCTRNGRGGGGGGGGKKGGGTPGGGGGGNSGDGGGRRRCWTVRRRWAYGGRPRRCCATPVPCGPARCRWVRRRVAPWRCWLLPSAAAARGCIRRGGLMRRVCRRRPPPCVKTVCGPAGGGPPPTRPPAPTAAPTRTSLPSSKPSLPPPPPPSPTVAPTVGPSATARPPPTATAHPTLPPSAAPTPTPSARPTPPPPTAAPTPPPPTVGPTPPPPTTAPTPPPPTPVPRPWAWGDGLRECTAANVRTRVEVRSMSAAARTRFTSALRSLADAGTFASFVPVHADNSAAAHFGPQFLPWHRLFLLELEGALRSVDPSVTLPYWDWSLDSATPATSPVWGTTYLGGSRPGACIPDGPFRGLRGRLPVDHCISRGFTSGTPGGMAGMTFEEPPVLAALVAAGTPYSTFADAVELAHNQPHIAVGAAQLLDAEGEPTAPPGDMWSLRVSCGDPAFWLHHAFVDKLWADRQAQRTPTEYNGAHSGRRVSPADVLPPFGVPVSTALTLPCVRYAPLPGGAAGGRRRRRVGGGKGRELRRPAVEAAVTAARAPRAAAEAAFARRAGASAAQVARGAAALVDAATDAVLAGELDVDVSSGPGGEGGGGAGGSGSAEE